MIIPALNVQPVQRTTKCGVCRQDGHNRRTCPVLRNPHPFPEPLQPDPTPVPAPVSAPVSAPVAIIPICDDISRDDNEDTCTICYEALNTSANFVSTPCKHRFCFNCIAQHMRNDNRCPMCRANLVTIAPPPVPVPAPRRRRRVSQPQQRQTSAFRANQHNWNNSLVVRVDHNDIIPLSQAIEPQVYEVILNDLSSLTLQQAQNVIDRVFGDENVF